MSIRAKYKALRLARQRLVKAMEAALWRRKEWVDRKADTTDPTGRRKVWEWDGPLAPGMIKKPRPRVQIRKPGTGRGTRLPAGQQDSPSPAPSKPPPSGPIQQAVEPRVSAGRPAKAESRRLTVKNVYGVNGLIFWDEQEIIERDHMARTFAIGLQEMLRAENPAWHLMRIEAPALTPAALINPNYTDEDVFTTADRLVMRPETTPGSYAYAQMLLDSHRVRPPFVVWQMGRSYRREQDQVTKNMRLKEFYQQEFQCIFTEDTKNDYMAAILPKLATLFRRMLGRRVRIVESDRLPSYSQKTMDIEVELPHKWMEVASISLRTDFPGTFRFTTGRGLMEKKILVLEVAIGLDRAVYSKLLADEEDEE